MNMRADVQLLQDYVREKSQEAFTELVRRHVNLVYSAALRQVYSPQLAKEVSQSVFIDLAKASGSLQPDTILTAWLYQVTRRTAIDVVRRESRRQAREQIAVEMAAMNTSTDWAHIELFLEDAMEALDETDRAAILLRYFENKSLREVGQALGTSDDAAQKRVSRAVERLREFLSKRGVEIGASGLVVVISANAVHAAPLALTTTISTAAVLAGAAVHTSTALAATKVIAMTTFQKTLIAATIAVLAGAGIHEARQASHLRQQNQVLQQQAGTLTGQIQQLQRQRDDLANRLSAQAGDLEKNKDSSLELLRLRSEVTRLRRDSQELAQLKASETNDSAQVELKSWLASLKQLKQEAQANPSLRIPEFSLLTEQDWLNSARLFGKRTQFDAQTALRVTMADLRQTAEKNFANLAQQELASYAKEHGGSFPTDLSQFQPYIPTAIDGVPVDGAILQRYKIVPAEKFGSKEPGQDWVLTQKELVDDEYDHRISIGPKNWGYHPSEAEQLPPENRALKHILDPVAKDFSAANHGQQPNDLSQLQPYLKTDEQKAAFQKMTELKNSNASANK
jgi:RNA polymerase sigma factor (sigma-70 family)